MKKTGPRRPEPGGRAVEGLITRFIFAESVTVRRQRERDRETISKSGPAQHLETFFQISGR